MIWKYGILLSTILTLAGCTVGASLYSQLTISEEIQTQYAGAYLRLLSAPNVLEEDACDPFLGECENHKYEDLYRFITFDEDDDTLDDVGYQIGDQSRVDVNTFVRWPTARRKDIRIGLFIDVDDDTVLDPDEPVFIHPDPVSMDDRESCPRGPGHCIVIPFELEL